MSRCHPFPPPGYVCKFSGDFLAELLKMSRCHPFPPPGYASKPSGDFLVELLKLRHAWALAEKKKSKECRRKRKRKRTEEAGEKGKLKQKRHSTHKRHKHRRTALDGAKSCSEESGVTKELIQQEISHCCSTSVTAAALMKGDEAALESEVSQSSESQYESVIRDLIVNWTPPSVHSVQTESHDLGNQRWLFEEVLTGRRSLRESRSIIEDLDDWNINASARYLPEADIYALPYTVAF